MRRSLPAALIAIVALPAAAQDASCLFTAECFEEFPCAPSEFAVELIYQPDPMAVLLRSPAGDAAGLVSTAPNGATLIFARGTTSQQILTIGTDGTARYTLHGSEGPLTVTYTGTCEEPRWTR